jgi:RNA-directed DNA polymerase
LSASNITQHESEPTSIWSFITRESGQSDIEEEQMTVSQTGASSHTEVNWHEINWRAVNGNVRRLQMRIVKATQAEQWGKVKALQWLLTHSFSGKALAVRRVTENQGRRTAGVDGEIWPKPQQRAAAILKLKRRGYRARPLRRIYIPKRNGRKRALSIPTMTDRAQQALHLLALDPVAETRSDGNSYGFRKERSTADAIAQCFNIYARGSSPDWVLECDIKSCFDEISQSWMERNIPMDRVILKQWLVAGYIEKQAWQATIKGLPQGGIISPTIMNITLNGLERILNEKFPQYYYKHNRVQVNYVRYADDFIISGISKQVLCEKVQPVVTAFLQQRGLMLSPEKTKITHIAKGFDFLGQNIRKYDEKLFITPAKENVQALLRKVREMIKAHKQLSAGQLIKMLNLRIKGWANYHRHVASKRAFTKIDSAIHQTLWQWAYRRHNNKSREWVMKKYFKTVGGDHWVFFGQIATKDKQMKEICLFSAARVPIVRHAKIKAAANPYDLEWESYFEQRIAEQIRRTLQGRWKLLKLWFGQKGICPVCQEKITKQTGWNMHHLVWRSHGGGEGAENLVLLHPVCHSQVHNLGLFVVKPDLEKDFRKA